MPFPRNVRTVAAAVALVATGAGVGAAAQWQLSAGDANAHVDYVTAMSTAITLAADFRLLPDADHDQASALADRVSFGGIRARLVAADAQQWGRDRRIQISVNGQQVCLTAPGGSDINGHIDGAACG